MKPSLKSSRACGLALLLVGAFSLQADERPNIIFLLSDDQSTYSVGCYGNPDVQTPNLDQLGADGLIFDKHYVSTAICMASRATAFTGKYEYRTGTNFAHGDMRPETWAQSYPVRLREAGYLTAFAGKFGLEVTGQGLCEKDFDYWGGSPGQSSYVTAQNKSMAKYAEEFPHSSLSYGAFGRDVIRDAAQKDQPFCLSISFKAPHMPSTPDPRFDDVYRDKTFTKPANYGREFSHHLSEQSKQGRQYPRFEEWGYADNYDAAMRNYHQLVHAVDYAVGMIREELAAQDLVDNTVIIFTSDNGFICGSHGYGSKVLPMEESSRVPLIVFDPRSPNAGKGLRSKQLTANTDFAPTIFALAGLEAPKDLDGQSLLPLLEDPTTGGHELISLINVFPPAPTMALTALTPQYKYTYWWYEGGDMEATEELFDLTSDPLELVNLATSPDAEEALATMRKHYNTQLEHWKTTAVPYNNYGRYKTLFDPAAPFSEKRPLLRKKK